jgi:hypothetical protein
MSGRWAGVGLVNWDLDLLQYWYVPAYTAEQHGQASAAPERHLRIALEFPEKWFFLKIFSILWLFWRGFSDKHDYICMSG